MIDNNVSLEKEIKNEPEVGRKPGVCIPWEQVRMDMGEIKGDEEILREIWEENDREAYLFFWQCVLSF